MQNREKEALGPADSTNITKSEVAFLLDEKVNKTEFHMQIDSLLRSLKKNRKLAALTSGLCKLNCTILYLSYSAILLLVDIINSFSSIDVFVVGCLFSARIVG